MRLAILALLAVSVTVRADDTDDFLKADKRVDSFHDAEPNQGGHGVTIVNLKV